MSRKLLLCFSLPPCWLELSPAFQAPQPLLERHPAARKKEREDALVQSVRLRLRPVLMPTISTFVGMLPIIIETSIGLERMSPLASAAGFGLLVGTFMTMIVTPVFYSILDDAITSWRRLWQRS